MDQRERIGAAEEDQRAALDQLQARMWTSLPAKVVSFDKAKGTAVLQPSVKSMQRMPDGTTKLVSLPQLLDVPVQAPGGGGATLTFPIKEGDEMLVVFASRSADAWKQSGGEQGQTHAEMHSLSHGFAIPGFRSSPRALANWSDDSTQLRSDDGTSVVSLKPGAGGGVTLKRGSLSVAVSDTRVDLGGPGGSAVQTVAGTSAKVFAVL